MYPYLQHSHTSSVRFTIEHSRLLFFSPCPSCSMCHSSPSLISIPQRQALGNRHGGPTILDCTYLLGLCSYVSRSALLLLVSSICSTHVARDTRISPSSQNYRPPVRFAETYVYSISLAQHLRVTNSVSPHLLILEHSSCRNLSIWSSYRGRTPSPKVR